MHIFVFNSAIFYQKLICHKPWKTGLVFTSEAMPQLFLE